MARISSENRKQADQNAFEPSTEIVRLEAEKNANFLSRLLFLWNIGLVWKGWKKPLQDEDLWELQENERGKYTTEKLAEAWERRKEKTYWRLVRSLWNVHSIFCLLNGLLRLLDVILSQISAVFLNKFLNFLRPSNRGANIGEGFIWAVALFLTPLTKTFVENQYYLRSQRLGMRVRSALQGLLYDKSLRMSPTARNTSTVGEIVNLMQLDSQRVGAFAQFMHVLWAAPLQLIVSIVLLYIFIGPSTFIGLLITVLSVPLQAKLIAYQSRLRKKTVKITDERVKLMNEILQGIKAVKFYAWEKPFAKEVEKIRAQELSTLRSTIWARALFLAIMMAIPTIMAVVTFAFYAGVFKNELDVAKVFSGLTLLSQLRQPVTMLPIVFTTLIDTKLGLKRIHRFLNLEDTSDYARRSEKDSTDGSLSATGEESDYSSDSGTAGSSSGQDTERSAAPAEATEQSTQRRRARQNGRITISDASFSWGHGGDDVKLGPKVVKRSLISRCLPRIRGRTREESSGAGPPKDGSIKSADSDHDNSENSTVLRDITMSLKPGQLTAVIGRVGAGKSSLVHAILGEMKKESGRVTLEGQVAYVAQSAWIFNGTLRNNILFGNKFDKKRYDMAIRVSALEMDLAQLSAGDQTAIGEKGINLSGGQKQRVSIARAVYADADIYIFDDPLSALDAGVAQSVFEKCISKTGVLRDRLRLLVTNQLQFLPRCDCVMLLEDGQLRKQGKYSTLMATDPEFKALMEESMAEDKEEGDGDPVHEFSTTLQSFSLSSNPERSQQNKSKIYSLNDSNGESKHARETRQKGFEAGRTLMTTEEREIGNITLKAYYQYAAACGSLTIFLFIFLFYCTSSSINILTTWWLSYWTEQEVTGTDRPIGFFLGIYFGLGIFFGVTVFLRSVMFLFSALVAARDLHRAMFNSVMRAPMMFFDTTPIGRMISRFARDVLALDMLLPQEFSHMFTTFINLIGAYISIGIVTPWFIAVAFPITLGYFALQRFYNRTSLALKRLDSISKSPIYANFSETLGGLSTIRAYGKQREFKEDNFKKIDLNQRAFFCLLATSRWFSLYLEVMGSILIFAAAIFGLLARDRLFAGLVGFSLTMAQQVTGVLGMTVRSLTQVEAEMNAVERISYYAKKLPQEAPAVVEKKPDTEGGSSDALLEWPRTGRVEIRNLSMRYRENLELVLKGMTVKFEDGEKVGIVGRTGAGKSSLMIALLRLVEPAGGSVIVDGVDISTIGLDLLRTKITIIPQEPVLFSGTLRFNLDPFGDYSEAEIWNALGKSQLKEFVSSFDGQLDGKVSEYGQNLSAGQRQLICLTRALLRMPKVLIMDEATSSVDFDTDQKIQETVRQEFAGCTVLTIAHRLWTVADYDKILVIDSGLVGEFGTPAELLEKKDGHLTALVDSMGEGGAEKFKELVRAKGTT